MYRKCTGTSLKESGGSDFILLANVRHDMFIALSSSTGEIEDTAF
jgi:hypothetical protein